MPHTYHVRSATTGFRSVVFGHIRLARDPEGEADRHNQRALESFAFGKTPPFRNIFRIEYDHGYYGKSMFIGGAFKDIELEWLVWFSHFTNFLSTLEAVEANVVLDCFHGRFAWTLAPEVFAIGGTRADVAVLVGQPWYIIQAPTIPENLVQLLHPVNTPVRIDEHHIYGS